jgi:hypothetical protein
MHEFWIVLAIFWFGAGLIYFGRAIYKIVRDYTRGGRHDQR